MNDKKIPESLEGLDMSQTTGISCKCGNQVFTHGFLLRKISKFVSPQGKEGIIPFPVFMCTSCGNMPDGMVPKFIKDEAEQLSKQSNLASDLSTNLKPQTPTLQKGNLTLIKD